MLYKKGNWQQFKRDGTITVKRTLNTWFKFFCALKLVLVGFMQDTFLRKDCNFVNIVKQEQLSGSFKLSRR